MKVNLQKKVLSRKQVILRKLFPAELSIKSSASILTAVVLAFAPCVSLNGSCVSLNGSAHAQGANPAARQAARQAALQARQFADSELFEQMERVSRWMDQYATWNQKFPDPGDETNWARTQMNALVPNNPYAGDKLQLMAGLDAEPEYADPTNSPGSYDTPPEMQGAALQESTSAQSVNENDDSGSIDTDTAANLNRVWLTYDPSLNENMAQEYLTDPPDDWSGQPGSINVVSNNQNLIVIWGAGANGKPIKFPGSNKTRLIIGRYKLLYGQSSY